MASQVLSGTGDVTYTNNTGQNVRIVINYMKTRLVSSSGLLPSFYTMSWASGVSLRVDSVGGSIGRNISFYNRTGGSTGGVTGNNYGANMDTGGTSEALAAEGAPVELIIAPGDTFSVVGGTENSRTIEIGPYNIVVIPEAG